MTGIDYFILAVLGISALTSLLRGFIAEVMSLLVWALALWVSVSFSGWVGSYFLSSIQPPAARVATSYIVLFLAVLVAGGLVTWMIRRMVAKTGLSSTDRLLGFCFGLARGLLMVFSAIVMAGFTAIPKEAWWQDSLLIPQLARGAKTLSVYLPDSVRQYLHFPTTETIDKAQPSALAPHAGTNFNVDSRLSTAHSATLDIESRT